MIRLSVGKAGQQSSVPGVRDVRWIRSAAAAALIIGSIGLAGPASAAAPPVNDTYLGATSLSGPLPITVAQPTVGATSDEVDASLNDMEEFCWQEETAASVWFTYSADTDIDITVDTADSDYNTFMIVAVGGPGAWAVQACDRTATRWEAAAGTTYTILVYDLDGGPGGQLALSLVDTPPPPRIDITVDPTGTFDARTGTATVSGMVTCTMSPVDPDHASPNYEFFTNLTQRRGRVLLSGTGWGELKCDGKQRAWSMVVESGDGKYKGGKADLQTHAWVAGSLGFGFGDVQRTVQLKGGKKGN